MCKPITVEGIAHKTGRKVTDPNVVMFVEATNRYRSMWPELLEESVLHYNSKKHNKLVALENKLHYEQKKSGIAIGILTPDQK